MASSDKFMFGNLQMTGLLTIGGKIDQNIGSRVDTSGSDPGLTPAG